MGQGDISGPFIWSTSCLVGYRHSYSPTYFLLSCVISLFACKRLDYIICQLLSCLRVQIYVKLLSSMGELSHLQ